MMGQLLSSHRARDKDKDDELDREKVFTAVKDGNVAQLQIYAEQIKDFQTLVNKDSRSLLHYAVTENKLNCVKFLVGHGVKIEAQDPVMNTPLLLAVESGSSDIHDAIRFLVQSKADINACNILGRTALLRSIITFRHKTAELLLELGADPNIADKDGLSPIHVCASYRSIGLLKYVLQHGAKIDCQDKKGRTALYFAVLAGHQDIVSYLLQQGCDVNRRSTYGTPLQTAIVKCNLDAVIVLLNSGATTVGKVTEQRILSRSRAANLLDLALIVLHMQLIKVSENTVSLAVAVDSKIMKALDIADLTLQAYGSDFKLEKTIRLLVHFANAQGSSEANAVFLGKLSALLRKLGFLQKLSVRGSSADGPPQTDWLTLENICRRRVRQLAMESNRNVIWCSQGLDCPRIVKDLLLIKDL